MSSAIKKPKMTDRIYVKGGGGKTPSTAPTHRSRALDDITLLALQIACPQRWEPGENQVFDHVHDIYNLNAITIETKNLSSLILLGTLSSQKRIEPKVQPLTQQVQNILKSSNEKVYFIESFQLKDPIQLPWDFFLKMSDYCFMQESLATEVFIGYFRLEKTADEDRFESKAVDSMVEGEVAEQDLYLHFKRNNRYIKIVKKGDSVEKKRIDRLQSRGITDIFISADQGTEIQQRRVHLILMELLENYETLIETSL